MVGKRCPLVLSLLALLACGDDSSTAPGAIPGPAPAEEPTAANPPADSPANPGSNPTPSTAAKVVLSASSLSITADGDVTLTATIEGGTADGPITFRDGTTSVGESAAAPYTQTVSFAFPDQGTRTYTATATVGGVTVTSDPVTVALALQPVGKFVDPATGNDVTGTGAEDAPFKTIAKAAATIDDGQSIYLQPGAYTHGSQTSLAYTFTKKVFIRGMTGGIVLQGSNSDSGFSFGVGGGIRDVKISGFNTGVIAKGTGTLDLDHVGFDNVGLPIEIGGSVTAKIDLSGTEDLLGTFRASSVFGFLVVDGSSTTSIRLTGQKIQDQTSHAVPFFCRGHSQLTVEGVTVIDYNQHVFDVFDNAQVVLKHVILRGSGLGTSFGDDKAAILMGGQNTEAPLTTALTLDHSEISGSQGPGIVLLLYGGIASTPVLTFRESHIDANKGGGLKVSAQGSLSPDLSVNLASTNTTFKDDSLGSGISAPRLTADISGGEISGNEMSGFETTSAASTNSLKMRRVALDLNHGNAIVFAGSSTSVLDLGKAGDDGKLTFPKVSARHAAVKLDAQITGSAVGNTWLPNTQGTDIGGHFTTATTLDHAIAGQNVNAASGASLVVF